MVPRVRALNPAVYGKIAVPITTTATDHQPNSHHLYTTATEKLVQKLLGSDRFPAWNAWFHEEEVSNQRGGEKGSHSFIRQLQRGWSFGRVPPTAPAKAKPARLGSPNPAEIATDEKDSQPSAMKQTWCPVRHEIPRFRGEGQKLPTLRLCRF